MTLIKPFSTEHTSTPQVKHHNYMPYVQLKKIFNPNEILKIQSLWKHEKLQDGRIGNNKLNINVRHNKIQFISQKYNNWLYERISMTTIMINSAQYKFEILGFSSLLQLTQYEEGAFYNWHTDYGAGASSQRKLTIVVQLSDPADYHGGELQFMDGGHEISACNEMGTAVIFPSYTAHRVTPVIRGCRYSLVGWIGGPPFR